MNTLQEDINLLLSDDDLLKKTRDIAQKNMDNSPNKGERGDTFVTRIYCQSFLDALIMEDYIVTIENNNINIKLKK